MSQEGEWETLKFGSGWKKETVERMRIPDGWICIYGSDSFFYPDAAHKWTGKELPADWDVYASKKIKLEEDPKKEQAKKAGSLTTVAVRRDAENDPYFDMKPQPKPATSRPQPADTKKSSGGLFGGLFKKK